MYSDAATLELRMNTQQRAVKAFHELLGHPCPDNFVGLKDYRKELRKKLIMEEAKEFCDAIDADDPVEAVDALADSLYVINGAAVEMGVNLAPFFHEVHLSNMAKGGPGSFKRPDGKQQKPPGWVDPDIRGMMVKLYGTDGREKWTPPEDKPLEGVGKS